MNVSWDDVRLFLAVAEARSMTTAARRLGLGQPTVSRRLQELERQLGYALFQRSVHGAELTAEAQRLVEPARRMAEWAAEVSRSASQQKGPPQGLVRITAPPYTCADFLGPFARRVREELPGVRLEIISAIGNLDLVRREADIALRRERPGQRDLALVHSLSVPAGIFATSAYRKRLPKKPSLSDIGFVSWAAPLEHLSPTPELTKLLPGFRPVFASNDILVQLAAAESSVGAMVLPRVRHRHSRASPLVLLDFDLGERANTTSHLVVAKTALSVPHIRAVTELLQAEMEAAIVV